MTGCASVRGNDWSVLVPEEGGLWTPRSTVSICIPTRNPGDGLVRTLKCLAEQTYPMELIEVVVADDGSEHPIELPAGLPYDARVVRQERILDFGAGQARNLAASAASGEILFFLDADVVPERQVVESYARWFSSCDLAVPMGLCRFVDVDDVSDEVLVELVRTGAMGSHFAGVEVDQQEWRELHFGRNADLRVESIDAFRVVIGATIAVAAAQFESVGGFPELGVRGVEDTAFGHRIHNAGGILILDRDAQHWHQGRRSLSEPEARARVNEQRAPYVESVIPVKGFRRGEPPVDPPVDVVPVARVRVRGPKADVEATVRSIEALDTANIAIADDEVGASSDGAFVQVNVPGGVLWTADTLRHIVDLMAQLHVGVIRAVVEGGNGQSIMIVRTRAISRAAHVAPGSNLSATAAKLFGSWSVDAASLGFRSPHASFDTTPSRASGPKRSPLAARAYDALVALLTRAKK